MNPQHSKSSHKASLCTDSAYKFRELNTSILKKNLIRFPRKCSHLKKGKNKRKQQNKKQILKLSVILSRAKEKCLDSDADTPHVLRCLVPEKSYDHRKRPIIINSFIIYSSKAVFFRGRQKVRLK